MILFLTFVNEITELLLINDVILLAPFAKDVAEILTRLQAEQHCSRCLSLNADRLQSSSICLVCHCVQNVTLERRTDPPSSTELDYMGTGEIPRE